MTHSLKTQVKTGDVVLADLGYVAKIRPVVVLAHQPDSQRAVSIIAPLTTQVRGGESEISFQKPPWLHEHCVLNLSGMSGLEQNRIVRRLGQFPADKLKEAKTVLAKIFGLEQPPVQPAS